MSRDEAGPPIRLEGFQRDPLPGGTERAILHTSLGQIPGILHPAPHPVGGVVWVCGALGGFDGPSFDIYSTIAAELVDRGIGSLRLHYRMPGEFDPCVLDVLAAVQFLAQAGMERVALVGHSFGGAVVIAAGTMSPQVVAVVGLSSQTFGAQAVAQLSPRPLLLVHGERDRNLPAECSEHIYRWALEPKELVIYQGSGHFLRECHDELHTLLKGWLIDKVGRGPGR